MKFKRLAAAVMAATMCGSLFVGCGNAKKDDTAAGEEKITATDEGIGDCAERNQADENGKWLQTMCDQFNSEHPDWDLTFEYGVCSEQDAGKIVPQDPRVEEMYTSLLTTSFRHLLMLTLLQSLVERQQIMLRKLTQMQLWIQYQ